MFREIYICPYDCEDKNHKRFLIKERRADCITEEELAVLAIELTTLGDMLSVIATKQAVCQKEKEV